MPDRTDHLRSAWLAAFLLGAGMAAPGPAGAVIRTCGADPVFNTTAVLCAPPSGPCTASEVVVSANLEIPTGGCDFDLGGRHLRVERTIQMTGGTSLWMRNASGITTTATAKLKVRGDYLRPRDQITAGGEIVFESFGPISHAGTLDVAGDPGGNVLFESIGDVVLERGSAIDGRGISSVVDTGGRLGDGGFVEIFTAGSIAIRGDVRVPGTSRGTGGLVYGEAEVDVTIERPIDASGGQFDGGEIGFAAARFIDVRADLAADSRTGGGFGGVIELFAGFDASVSGGVTIDGAVLQVSGSSLAGFGGDGGRVEIEAVGPIRIQGTGAAVRANAGGAFDGGGGDILLAAADGGAGQDDAAFVYVDAPLAAESGNAGGRGGLVDVFVDGDVDVRKPVSAFGKSRGGQLHIGARGDVRLDAAIDLTGKSAAAGPGRADVRAFAGAIALAADLRTHGGAASSRSGVVALSACRIDVASSVKIDGRSGTANGVAGGSVIQLKAPRPMTLGDGSRYLAGPNGRIETIHPPGRDPVIGANVVFDPLRTDTVIPEEVPGVYETCPAP